MNPTCGDLASCCREVCIRDQFVKKLGKFVSTFTALDKVQLSNKKVFELGFLGETLMGKDAWLAAFCNKVPRMVQATGEGMYEMTRGDLSTSSTPRHGTTKGNSQEEIPEEPAMGVMPKDLQEETFGMGGTLGYSGVPGHSSSCARPFGHQCVEGGNTNNGGEGKAEGVPGWRGAWPGKGFKECEGGLEAPQDHSMCEREIAVASRSSEGPGQTRGGQKRERADYETIGGQETRSPSWLRCGREVAAPAQSCGFRRVEVTAQKVGHGGP
ncbi:hypothetical protein NDU88_011390 [Pleurodeles waltl]|uniref:Uncharacterized protein n=1 Tax=Pleurodeles waltl TaxID=8319 RepID=A0AAV7Q0L9_PLEWA|nr:hypothetical protein NDU88_011390 [Pleurodeles waltl]